MRADSGGEGGGRRSAASRRRTAAETVPTFEATSRLDACKLDFCLQFKSCVPCCTTHSSARMKKVTERWECRTQRAPNKMQGRNRDKVNGERRLLYHSGQEKKNEH